MFAAMGLAAALAITPAGATATTGAYQELPAAWAASYLPLPAGWDLIEVGEWNLITYNDDQLALVMAARKPMHIWVRMEYKRALTGGTRSDRALVQVDCNARRVRTVSVDYFDSSNLKAPALLVDEASAWESPPPSTMGEVPLRVLCD